MTYDHMHPLYKRTTNSRGAYPTTCFIWTSWHSIKSWKMPHDNCFGKKHLRLRRDRSKKIYTYQNAYIDLRAAILQHSAKINYSTVHSLCEYMFRKTNQNTAGQANERREQPNPPSSGPAGTAPPRGRALPYQRRTVPRRQRRRLDRELL